VGISNSGTIACFFRGWFKFRYGFWC